VLQSRSLVALSLSIVLAASAHAQSTTESTQSSEAAQWRIYASGGRSMPNRHGQVEMQSFNFERSKKYRKQAELGLVFSAHLIDEPRSWFGHMFGDGNDKVPAAGVSLILRRQFGNEKATSRPFVEISSGPMWASERVPAATSHFNFLSQAGFGYVFRSDRPVSWVVGWHFAHVSNGGYGRLNSGLNINSIMIGTQFR